MTPLRPGYKSKATRCSFPLWVGTRLVSIIVLQCLQNLVLIGELQRKRQSEWDSYNDEQKKEVVTIHT